MAKERLINTGYTSILPAMAGGNERRHVLLVHGIDDDGRIFRSMSRHLAEAGYAVHIAEYRPSDGTIGIDDLALRIAAFIEQELRQINQFDVVAFSMGGLIVRYYLQNLNGAERISRLITICTPHRGSVAAYFRWNKAGRQMRPGAAFLKELNADLRCYRNIRWATARTPFDLMVLPSSNATMAIARNASFPVVLHPLMVSSRRVIAFVLEFLGQ